MVESEWDDAKRRTNLRKHGVDFVDAAAVFDDPFGVDIEERSMDYGEMRRKVIGYAGGQLLAVTYAPRKEKLRLISARKASRSERRIYEESN